MCAHLSSLAFFPTRVDGPLPAAFDKKFLDLAGWRRSENIFGRNFRSRAQIKVQVLSINSVQVSSKSELSSGTLGRVKVLGLGKYLRT